MRYRFLQAADIQTIFRLGKKDFASELEYSWDWNQKEIRAYLKKSYGFGLVALNKKVIVGFVLINKHYSSQRPEVAWLTYIWVAKEYRGQKIGSELLQKAGAHLRKMGKRDLITDIYASNTKSIQFFEKHTFQKKETWFILSRKV